MTDTLKRLWNDWVRGSVAAAADRAQARLAAYPWSPGLLAALERLRADGHQAYLVGGTVRDVLLGREAGPIADVATDLLPEQVMERFARTEPIGLQHGTVLILEPDVTVECTTFRREGSYSDARRPDHVAFSNDPLVDLDRRDLTVNALAFDPGTQVLLDPHGGALDIERHVLRAVGDPLDRFREDGLRPLRVARFVATLGFQPEAELWAALNRIRDPESGYSSRGVAMERVRDELVKMLAAPKPSTGLEVLRESGLLEVWLPELARSRGVPQNRFHAYDVYFHSLYACDAAPADKPVVRWAALLHDIGKPDTRVERDGEGTFYNHQLVGAEMGDRVLERLRFAADFRAAVVHLVREHMFDYRPGASDAALRRWLRRVGVDAVADLFDLRIADALGNGLRQGFPTLLDRMREHIERLVRESSAFHVRDLAVDGHDVMRVLGIGPGPAVREALEALLEEVLDRPERNTRDHLIARLTQWSREREREAPDAT